MLLCCVLDADDGADQAPVSPGDDIELDVRGAASNWNADQVGAIESGNPIFDTANLEAGVSGEDGAPYQEPSQRGGLGASVVRTSHEMLGMR